MVPLIPQLLIGTALPVPTTAAHSSAVTMSGAAVTMSAAAVTMSAAMAAVHHQVQNDEYADEENPA